MKASNTIKNFADRFKGREGKIKLIEVLQNQPLINGNKRIASKIASIVKPYDIKPQKTVTKQGDADNDLFFILSGSVSIQVNNRNISVRNAGEHIGEMSMLDCTSRRSATIITNELCTLAKLTETQFKTLAKSHPILWKHLAITLIARLRERNKFHKYPNTKPIVFIGSSSEGLDVAKSLFKYLSKYPIVPLIWNEGLFEASKSAIEDLLMIIPDCDFAILVLTPDDKIKSRKKEKLSPRDNVIFELGLFMGGLGRDRTYIVCPKVAKLKIPSDLLGVTRLEYNDKGKISLSSKLINVKKQIYKLIIKYSSK